MSPTSYIDTVVSTVASCKCLSDGSGLRLASNWCLILLMCILFFRQ